MANNNETISRDGKDTKVENKTSKPEQRKERKGIIGYFTGVKQEMAKVVWADESGTDQGHCSCFWCVHLLLPVVLGDGYRLLSSAQEASRNYAIEIG